MVNKITTLFAICMALVLTGLSFHPYVEAAKPQADDRYIYVFVIDDSKDHELTKNVQINLSRPDGTGNAQYVSGHIQVYGIYGIKQATDTATFNYIRENLTALWRSEAWMRGHTPAQEWYVVVFPTSMIGGFLQTEIPSQPPMWGWTDYKHGVSFAFQQASFIYREMRHGAGNEDNSCYSWYSNTGDILPATRYPTADQYSWCNLMGAGN